LANTQVVAEGEAPMNASTGGGGPSRTVEQIEQVHSSGAPAMRGHRLGPQLSPSLANATHLAPKAVFRGRQTVEASARQRASSRRASQRALERHLER
jgi:hypothetical protein